MSVVTEEICITKVDGESVSYSGSNHFYGCNISFFPSKPKIGKKYLLISDFILPSTLIDVEN